MARPAPADLPLGLELTGDEPDGHDPVPLGGVEQAGARPVPRRFVFELHLAEAGEALRTWAASWIGNRRTPREST